LATGLRLCQIKEISDLLKHGLANPIGGHMKSSQILSKFEIFFDNWISYAKKNNFDIFTINKVKSLLFLSFDEFKNCTMSNNSRKTLIKFLCDHPENLFLNVDKTKNLAYVRMEDYLTKFDEIFSPDKFQKIKKNPIQKNLREYRKLIQTLAPFLTKSDQFLLTPCENLKTGYGLLKLHKKNAPLRPIVSSLNSICSGAETFLHNLIKPIVKNCKFSIKSTKHFKNNFPKFSKKFNEINHEIISIDCVSLYTSVNITRVVDHILDIIYKKDENGAFINIDQFLPEFEKTEIIDGIENKKTIKPPPAYILKTFFLNILTKFNSFETLTGFYTQKEGCSMGSKLSPGLANIFCDMFEKTIISSEIEKGNILEHCRYADDCLLLIKKGTPTQFSKN